MKKKYYSPEFDLTKIKFDVIMSEHVQHSIPEDFHEGGEEGPDD